MVKIYIQVLLLCGALFSFSIQSSAQCSAGDLQSTGEVTVSPGETFVVETINEELPPTPGGFGWLFDNAITGGGGATGSEFILINAVTIDTFDNTLSNILPASNLASLTGTWVIKGVAYTDPNGALGSICSTTVDSLIVTFDQGSATCSAGIMQTVGEIDVPAGDQFNVMAINDTVPPAPGGYGWVFDNANTNGTGALDGTFIFSGTMTDEMFDNDLNGLLSANGLPPFQGTWIVRGAAYTDGNNGNAFVTICSTTTDSLIVNFGEVEFVCESGVMLTTGTEVVCGPDAFDVEVADVEVPAGGNFGLVFENSATGGTGAVGVDFVIFGFPNMVTLDRGLSGFLAQNNIPDFEGTWVIKGAVIPAGATGNPLDALCSTTADSLIVVFDPEIELEIENQNNTEVVSSVSGGTAPYAYSWSNGETTSTATELVDGDLTVTVTDAVGCTVEETINLLNTSVEDIQGLVSYNLGPNPTNDISHLNFQLEDEQNIQISIRSLDGKFADVLINEFTSGGNYDLDLSGYSAGIYLLHIATEQGQYASRIVKN